MRYVPVQLLCHCGKVAIFRVIDADWRAKYGEGTPISKLSGQPGTKGFDAFCEIARSWGLRLTRSMRSRLTSLSSLFPIYIDT